MSREINQASNIYARTHKSTHNIHIFSARLFRSLLCLFLGLSQGLFYPFLYGLAAGDAAAGNGDTADSAGGPASAFLNGASGSGAYKYTCT